jgi:hypothetical protein
MPSLVLMCELIVLSDCPPSTRLDAKKPTYMTTTMRMTSSDP